MDYYITNNTSAAVCLRDIPTVDYAAFYDDLCGKLACERYHLAHYFAYPEQQTHLRFYCLLLDDEQSQVLITSFVMDYYAEDALPSLTARYPQVHLFEREITELFGVQFEGLPWDKPLRYPFNRARQGNTIDNYPFYTIESSSLHEVNVGPIHAGIIEPGAFRFICNGEQVLHLEIALGYQHRGVEHAFTATRNSLRQVVLAESVAGDSAVSHATAFVETVEKLASHSRRTAELHLERAVALELERMAMHIADTAALCTDVGYQLGQVACEALRTLTINTTQAWCGNRFGKGLIRPFGTNHPLTVEKATQIAGQVAEIQRRYEEVSNDIQTSPTLLARLEQCGVVSREEMVRIGAVGQAARACGLARDIRTSHPWGVFAAETHHTAILKDQGDVMARLQIRQEEVVQSADYIQQFLANFIPSTTIHTPIYDFKSMPDALSFALIEGWRGEICHVAVTDSQGAFAAYKIKDPSLHNWPALALAVRGEGISDFPICNKSFNLSYCGHDL
ncbi:MAG: NADH-quinone oxidoreductase subunit C [Alistipes sp.]